MARSRSKPSKAGSTSPTMTAATPQSSPPPRSRSGSIWIDNRRPGEGRDPPFSLRDVEKWIPAFAGMTIFKKPGSGAGRRLSPYRPRRAVGVGGLFAVGAAARDAPHHRFIGRPRRDELLHQLFR